MVSSRWRRFGGARCLRLLSHNVGDMNTHFFHRKSSQRKVQNTILITRAGMGIIFRIMFRLQWFSHPMSRFCSLPHVLYVWMRLHTLCDTTSRRHMYNISPPFTS